MNQRLVSLDAFRGITIAGTKPMLSSGKENVEDLVAIKMSAAAANPTQRHQKIANFVYRKWGYYK